jgi:HD-GYP domain-containing protein (c-di-GMP phosphodiesterase class II)/DNA-binding CsgD family transcriptional regulator
VDDEVRLADLLAALSVTTDLGMGNEPEKAIRSCLLATEVARASGLPEVQVRDVYYATLLVHLGCTAPSHEIAIVFGDDVGVLPRAERTDDATLRGSLELLGLVGRGTGARRVQHLVRLLAAGKEGSRTVMRSVCEVGLRMAERLHLGDRVVTALGDSTEVWDGSGGAYGRAGDDIALPARIAMVATQAVIFDRLGGPDAAVEVVRDRAGHWFDPDVADTFARVGPQLLHRMTDADVWHEVLEVEPRPVRCIPLAQLDEVARVFADLVDLKSIHTLGHSTGVAELASDAAARLRLPVDRVTTVRQAGLLHDLGRVAVSAGVWEQPRPLTSNQWEQVRLHPYQTERILSRSATLAELGPVAGMHHERLDGSGYHHGASGAAIPAEARLLAAADVFQAMTQDRPHRPAMAPDQAAHHLGSEAATGGLDVDCARAVVEAAGHRPGPGRRSWPAGLTDREVDVLRLVATGFSNREVAAELVISPRTAEHHVQHIYAKIGGSTRAAAAVFAMEHGLLR